MFLSTVGSAGNVHKLFRLVKPELSFAHINATANIEIMARLLNKNDYEQAHVMHVGERRFLKGMITLVFYAVNVEEH